MPITIRIARRYLVDEALRVLVPALLLALAPAPTATAVPEAPAPAQVEAEDDAAPDASEAVAPLPEVSEPIERTPPALPPPKSSNVAHRLEARPEVQVPALEGEALRFVAASLGGLGLILKVSGTLHAMNAAKEADRREAEPPSEHSDEGLTPQLNPIFNFRGVVSNIMAAALLTSSAPLLGSGLGMYGRWVAHFDVAEGRPRDRRGTGLMLGFGVGAIGLGVAALVITSAVDDSAPTHAKATAIRETGYWTATAGILGGVGLAGYGLGYQLALRRLERRLQARIAPVLSREIVGVGVAGRF